MTELNLNNNTNGTTPTQPTITPTPNDATDWKRKYDEDLAAANRKYDGLQGAFKQQKDRADKLDSEVKTLTQGQEGELATLKSTKVDLETKLQTVEQEKQQLAEKHQAAEMTLTTYQTILEKFPNLAEAFQKGVLNIAGLRGDQLETYLKNTSEYLAAAGVQQARQQVMGSTPPPPNGTQTPMDQSQITDKIRELVRTKGKSAVNSDEYRQLRAMEDELIRKRGNTQLYQPVPNGMGTPQQR